MSEFTSLMERLRREKGISLGHMARAIGVTHAYMSLIQNGHREPTDALVYEIAMVLGVDMDLFFAALGRVPPDAIKLSPVPGAALSVIKALRLFANDISESNTGQPEGDLPGVDRSAEVRSEAGQNKGPRGRAKTVRRDPATLGKGRRAARVRKRSAS